MSIEEDVKALREFVRTGKALDFESAPINLDLLSRLLAELEARGKDAAELSAWKARVIKAAEEAHGPAAFRFKFSLRANGTATNVFPSWLDERWVSFVYAEDDAHIGYIAKALDTALSKGAQEGVSCG